MPFGLLEDFIDEDTLYNIKFIFLIYLDVETAVM